MLLFSKCVSIFRHFNKFNRIFALGGVFSAMELITLMCAERGIMFYDDLYALEAICLKIRIYTIIYENFNNTGALYFLAFERVLYQTFALKCVFSTMA